MNIVETTAPIAIEDLKKYFADKETFYLINYKDSELKGEKLLTYLSNLDVPSDIKFSNLEEIAEMIAVYAKFNLIVSVPSLEEVMANLLLEYNNKLPQVSEELLEAVKDELPIWDNKIKSCSLFNMYSIECDEFKEFALSHTHDDTDSTQGINFVSLLKYSNLFAIFDNVDHTELKFYTKYFNDYMFKGKNLYAYWANVENPLFVLSWNIGNDTQEMRDYVVALHEE
jgi:hypothetical protein